MFRTITALLREQREILRTRGLRDTFARITGKERRAYRAWYRRAEEERRKEASDGAAVRKDSLTGPISWDMIYIGGNADAADLKKIWNRQTYTNWKLVCVKTFEEAERLADGDYALFPAAGDNLAEDGLAILTRTVEENPAADFLYMDEDEWTAGRKLAVRPHFKPDYNEELLSSCDYIRYGFAVKRELWKGWGEAVDCGRAGWRYDLILRCAEQAGRMIHIPRILYHHQRTGFRKELALLAGEWQEGGRYLNEHYRRLGIPAEAEKGRFAGSWWTKFHWREQPLVSILIPSKDHAEDLNRCINSVREKSEYLNYEILIIENNSEKEETFENYRRLSAADSRIRVAVWEGEFHYSRINNYGVSLAKGDYLLFLNNDTELIAPASIGRMLDYCRCPGVGAAGAKLYYADGSIQHAGVVIGYGGTAGHAFITMPGTWIGYERRAVLTQNYSAVTAACLMTRRDVFEAAGGFSEEFRIAFNDIDYCLKTGKNGKRVVYLPDSEWFHYESKSRGYEDTKEKQERFAEESRRFREKWEEFLRAGDPCYNPNLSLERADFARKEFTTL